MLNKGISVSFKLSNGRDIVIETGKLAKQANGAVEVKMGDTMLLATAVTQKEPLKNVDFIPLTVEYQEKFASTGRIPGGFIKRETRPSNSEILTARLVDRTIRPLFPSDYFYDTIVQISLISGERNYLPDVLACLAASSALMVSDIPFNGPVSEVRVAKIKGKFVINPSISALKDATFDIIVGATYDNIVMVEGEAKEISELEMIDVLKFAHEAIKPQCQAQIELTKLLGKIEKKQYVSIVHNEDLKERLKTAVKGKIYEIAKSRIKEKQKRKQAFNLLKQEFIDSLTTEISSLTPEEAEEYGFLINIYFHEIERDVVRNLILQEKIRLDGRRLDEIRPIWCEVDYLPSAHGSAIFTRGETQSLTTVTLGTKLDAQIIDGAIFEGAEKFYLHYNFPGFSTGEVKPSRAPSRREIGHGNLAYRAIKEVLPSDDENPYTIRVVSDILESNGSSSMATVCAASLALCDAGMKIKKPVAGIAMGLITDNSGNYAILSDILGDEDHLGDMDFKIAGTRDGIMACQMDIKTSGLSYEVLAQALEQAKIGRMFILNEMSKTISEPRKELKPHAPRIEKIFFLPEFIGSIIGPNGKIIQGIQKETNTTIIIEEKDDTAWAEIFSDNKESIEKAKERIKKIAAIPEIGEIYEAQVKKIMPYGAFVEFLPSKEGLLHISEITTERLMKVEDALQEGDTIKVKLIGIDEKTGKFKLSRKVLFQDK